MSNKSFLIKKLFFLLKKKMAAKFLNLSRVMVSDIAVTPVSAGIGDIQLDFQKRKIVLNNSRFQCLVPRRNGFEYLIAQ